jgi:ferredoxin
LARYRKVRILAPLCQKCGSCVEICPEGLFSQASADIVPKILNPNACISCGHCISICPSGAIEHVDFPVDDFAAISGI